MKVLKKIIYLCFVSIGLSLSAQDYNAISYPLQTKSAIAFSVGSLKDLSQVETTKQSGEIVSGEKTNKNMSRNVPFDSLNPPTVSDNLVQRSMGLTGSVIKQNWEALSTTASATDCNGAAGPNHYVQAVNFSFAVYDKQGAILLQPILLNNLFSDIMPSNAEGKGDPVVIYDEHANRWLIAEFASGPYDASYTHTNPNYIFVAVSQTEDPTGAWYKWAFEVNAFPDYFKIGVGENGYFIGSNPYYHPSGAERFMVMDRTSMLAGEADPELVTFESSQIPGSSQGVFHVVQPVDTDGPFAPAGSAGTFITINDDAWGGNDQLWVYELNVDWDNTSSATVQRTQTIDVEPFVSQFNTSGGQFNDLDCVVQKGTDTKIDAVSTVLMFRAQYRNFEGEQKIVCYHTVNVDGQNQAGLRWYELEKTTGEWSIRQQGTYAPDNNSRWMGGIGMNGDKEIAIGYSISSSNMYPSIRFSGQSNDEYQNASGILDIDETVIYEGTLSKTSNSRWVDYTNLTIDPSDDHTFWFTNSFVKSAYENGSYITAFEFTTQSLSAGFSADNTTPVVDATVNFTDGSVGNITSWNWTITPNNVNYISGTNASSENPQVQFTQAGSYTISLEVSDGTETDIETKTAYIEAISVGINRKTKSGEIIVYENAKHVYCKVPNDFSGKITIYDALGKIIYNNLITGKPIKISKNGVYIIRVVGQDKYYSGKIIIN